MSDAPGSVLVVGGGVAGFAVIRELRRLGFTGAVTLVDPQGLPYDRPPLSKDYLTGETDARRLLLAPPEWFAEHDVDVVTARVARLDLAGERPAALLEDGARRGADVLVLATGGRPRPLTVPGGNHPDLLVLRTRDDADRLAARLHVGARVAVVGAGFTGAEVASAAREALAEVTLVASRPRPAETAVGPALAARLQAQHAERGVTVLQGSLTGIEHADAGAAGLPAAHRLHVRGADGADHAVDADVVVAAVGTVPDVALAVDAGLETELGVLVDDAGRTSHPAVYAVGDVAQRCSADSALAGTGASLAPAWHWEPAMLAGAAAAAAILGQDVSAPGAPWFWSDRHGSHVEGVGSLVPPPGGRLVDRVVRGVPVASFALDADGRMTGAASVDDPMAVKAARRIVDRGIVVDQERLADPDVPVKALLRG